MSSAGGQGIEDTDRASPRLLQACLALLSHLLHLHLQHTAIDLGARQSSSLFANAELIGDPGETHSPSFQGPFGAGSN